MAKVDPTTNSKIDQLDKTVNFVTWALFIIVATLLFGLGAIVNDYLAQKQATYQSLVDKINVLVEQNKAKDQSETEREITSLKSKIYLLQQAQTKADQSKTQ